MLYFSKRTLPLSLIAFFKKIFFLILPKRLMLLSFINHMKYLRAAVGMFVKAEESFNRRTKNVLSLYNDGYTWKQNFSVSFFSEICYCSTNSCTKLLQLFLTLISCCSVLSSGRLSSQCFPFNRGYSGMVFLLYHFCLSGEKNVFFVQQEVLYWPWLRCFYFLEK